MVFLVKPRITLRKMLLLHGLVRKNLRYCLLFRFFFIQLLKEFLNDLLFILLIYYSKFVFSWWKYDSNDGQGRRISTK
jgi:hypothetical protein